MRTYLKITDHIGIETLERITQELDYLRQLPFENKNATITERTIYVRGETWPFNYQVDYFGHTEESQSSQLGMLNITSEEIADKLKNKGVRFKEWIKRGVPFEDEPE